MNRFKVFALCALVPFVACRPDISVTNITEVDGGGHSSDTTKTSTVYGVVVLPKRLDVLLGPCAPASLPQLTATVLGSPQSIIWRSLNAAVATVDLTGVVSPVGPGTTRVVALAAADTTKADTATVAVAGCLIPETPHFIGGFVPPDSTILFSTSYDIEALAVLPGGVSRLITVVSLYGCVAPTSTSITTVGGDTVRVRIRLMGIKLCRESVSVSLAANPNEERSVWVTVTSLPQTADTTVTLVPNTGSGAPGTRLQTRCLVVASPPVSNPACTYYSTNPGVFLVMPDDRTLAQQNGPWLPGIFYLGGLIHFLSRGTAQECTFLKVDPRYADCGTFTTTGPSGVVDVLSDKVEPRQWEVPEPLRYLIR